MGGEYRVYGTNHSQSKRMYIVIQSILTILNALALLVSFFVNPAVLNNNNPQPNIPRPADDLERATWRGIPMEELRNLTVLVHSHVD